MTVLVLLILSIVSYSLNQRIITSTIAFSFFWIVGFALKYIYFPEYQFQNPVEMYVLTASCVSLLIEILVKALVRPGITKNFFLPDQLVIRRIYMITFVFCLFGSLLKLYAVYSYFGDWRILINGDLTLRDAVISRNLIFSSTSTTLLSFGYVAAAISGYLVLRGKIKIYYFLHLIPFFLDSIAIAGRGSFLIAMVITFFSFFLVVPVRFNLLRLVIITVGFPFLLFIVSNISGRKVEDNLVQYLTVPIFGLDNFLNYNYNSNTSFPSTFNAIFSRIGLDTPYEPDTDVFFTPFRSNVFSGFRETLYDFQGFSSIFLFIIFFSAQFNTKLFFKYNRIHNLLYAVAFLAFVTYYYFISLSAFLPAWWVILFFGLIMNLRDMIRNNAIPVRGFS